VEDYNTFFAFSGASRSQTAAITLAGTIGICGAQQASRRIFVS
jgi:hypothetical protein